MLLYGWKGAGGHSGYSWYELEDPTDYDSSDPNDYNPNDTDAIQFGPGLVVFPDSSGPGVPDGFTVLDSDAKPNYRIVIDDTSYSATLCYKDEVGEPRALNVCVVWRDDGASWDESEAYRSVTLTIYAND